MKNIELLIKILQKINKEEQISHQEAMALNGFGAMSFLLRDWSNNNDWSKTEKANFVYMSELKEQLTLLSNRTRIQFQSLQNDVRSAVLSSYYTPIEVIDPLCSSVAGLAEAQQIKIENILEPAVGTGRFLPSLRHYFKEARVEGIEKNAISALIARNEANLLGDCRVYNNEFQNLPYSKRYDLIISNIPFAKTKIVDANTPKEMKPFLDTVHGFYFAKSLALLKSGGYLAFISTTGIMDNASHQDLRRYLMQNSNLVSAIRLPNHVFAAENTRVTTDIIVLQKTEQKTKKQITAKEQLFISNPSADLFSNAVEINPYYLTYANNLCGTIQQGNQYGGSGCSLICDVDLQTLSYEISNRLDTDFYAYAGKVYIQPLPTIPNNSSEELTIEELHYSQSTIILAGPWERVGDYVVREEDGHQFFLEVIRPVSIDGKECECQEVVASQIIPNSFPDRNRVLYLLIRLRETTTQILLARGNAEEQVMSELTSSLNAYYDELRQKTNLSLNEFLAKSKYHNIDSYLLNALEKKDGSEYVKADIFKVEHNTRQEYCTSDLLDAIIYSYNQRGKVDADLCAEVLQMPKNQFIQKALYQDYLMYDISEDKLCLPNAFLSGDILTKISDHNQLLSCAKPEFLTDEQICKQLAALNKVLPMKTPIENIRPQLGEVLFSPNVYQSFWGWYLSPVNPQEATKGITLMYHPHRGYKVLVEKSMSNVVDSKLAIRLRGRARFSGIDMIEAIMNGDNKFFTYKDHDGVVKPDYAANNAFVQVKEQVKVKWQEYYMQQPQIRTFIEDAYYKSVAFLPKRPDGHLLKCDELTAQNITPYPYQLDGIAMILENNGGLEQQPTGGGKTITMITAAMKLKQCGIVRKPMICGLIANVEEIYQTARTIYPHARILYADRKQFKNNADFFAQVATQNWDLVIMTHSLLSKIAQHKETVLEVLNEELRFIEEEIMFLKKIDADAMESRLTKRELKGLEVRKENKKAEIQKWLSYTHDSALDIIQLGIDHIIVDEAHYFKNLSYSTRHRNIAGLNPQGSARAGLLYMHIRAIRNCYYNGEDKGLTFVTATPIQNYVAEQYTLDRLFNMKRLKEEGFPHFDAYMHTFFDVNQAIELSVTNQFVTRTRIRGYVKLDLLRKMAREYTHIVTREEMQRHAKKLPQKHIHHIRVPRNEEQKQYLFDLLEFAGCGDRNMIQRDPVKNEADGAEMLLASTYANLAALDMRLIDQEVYADYGVKEHPTKVGELCKKVAEIYYKEDDNKGTQLIFCNEGVPGGGNFNLYQEIKDVLVGRYHLPEQEIRFIHDYKTDEAREKLRTYVNAGTVRVVLGSVQKLGTGINFQKRLKAGHLLDIPWRPCDYDQCIGRIERPGNIYEDVDIFFYSTLETPDATRYEILNNKKSFIEQISNNIAFEGNTIAETGTDPSDIDYNKMMAVVTGNKTLLSLVDAQDEYNQVSASLYYKMLDINNAKRGVLENKALMEQYSNRVERIKNALSLIGNSMPPLGSQITYTTPDGQILSEKRFGEYVLAMVQADKVRAVVTLASFGKRFIAQLVPSGDSKQHYRIQASVLDEDHNVVFTITHNRGEVTKNPKTIGENPVKAINNIPIALQLNTDKLEQYTRNYSEAQQTLQSFDKEELRGLQNKQVTLAQKVNDLKNKLKTEQLALIDEKTRIKYKDIKNTTFTEAEAKLQGQDDLDLSKGCKIIM